MSFTLFKNQWSVAIFAALLFIPFLGNVHLFDWDEINFAESAREMLATGNYFSVQINYQRFWEKPPLFFWMQVLSMRLFGVNEFAARFPNAVCGIVTLVVLFRIGKQVVGLLFANIWVLVYAGTLFTFTYFKSGIIDPWFNLFIFSSLWFAYQLQLNPKHTTWQNALLSGFFIGLAVLTKGPVAGVLWVLCLLFVRIVFRKESFIPLKWLLLALATAIMVSMVWFGVDLLQNGPWFLIEFVNYQIRLLTTSEAGHGEPFFYHWWVLLLGCFPASIFFIKGLTVKISNRPEKVFKRWMTVLFWVTLLVFSIVKTKIVHYSSLCWLPLTGIAAFYLQQWWLGVERPLQKGLQILLGIIGGLLGVIFTALPFLLMQKALWVNKIHDVFVRGNLEASFQWHWWHSIGGIFLLAGVFGFFLIKQQQVKIYCLFGSMVFCTFLTTTLVTPGIEAVTQSANIDFFKAHANEDCYVDTYGYKSYAHFFYAAPKPPSSIFTIKLDSILFENSSQPDTVSLGQREERYRRWLYEGAIDKPLYISAKIQSAPQLDTNRQLIALYKKNGFAFYKRPAAK